MARKTKPKGPPGDKLNKGKGNRESQINNKNASTERNVRRKISEQPWEDGELTPQFTKGREPIDDVRRNRDRTEEQMISQPLEVYHARRPGQKRTPPPDIPSSIDPRTHLAPPEADDPLVRSRYEVDAIAVTNNTAIRHAVTRLLAALKPLPEPVKGQPQAKPVIVALMARAAFANKCISVAEISKRKLNAQGEKWCQYTGFWSRVETFEPPKPAKRDLGINVSSGPEGVEVNKNHTVEDSTMAIDDEVEDQEETAFEDTPMNERRKIRQIPCLVIYLSRGPIPRLKELYK